ncbi:hypothetical protein ERO13_A13G156300v2 [Gossypium hirsutum]|uniref:UPF0481 protein At3g02645 n=1 Tax=Gossypium hirsutum TaxID=3635 RepID=A0A1U8HXE2_GOSHI|nr:putative UPF0481 protein At3g02645 [Gossypium hirsutum]KAG4166817.1 hypothetical protein ERO13_A13G156300v2 [Gossypium hirsutum]
MGSSSPERTTWHCIIEIEHGHSSSQEISPTIIFKVPRRLREVNERAYEPNVISVGPYHYRKPHLARMEDIKKRWFEEIVDETHLGLDQFRKEMKHLERKTRKCYEQPLPPDLEDEEKFVDMMVYDGCFVVQLIRKGHLCDFWKLGLHVSRDIRGDLLLLENQLPFFVLLKLYGMIEPNPGPRRHFCKLVTSALVFFDRDPPNVHRNTASIRHLLGLVHSTFYHSLLPTQAEIARREENFQIPPYTMPSATELEDAGIHFSGVPIQNMQNQNQGTGNMFDITFDNSTKELKIPILAVGDSTERTFGNYMAYEQLFAWEVPNFFVDYVVFMDKLINTSKDVELLRKNEIIVNLLGNNEAVTQMFNKLAHSVYYSPECFYYRDIASQVNEHCKRKRNIWKAKLKKDYFNTPWSPILFLAALVLLLLTILQTIFSVLSYYHQKQ